VKPVEVAWDWSALGVPVVSDGVPAGVAPEVPALQEMGLALAE
jgi:hypothetical protein